MNRNGRTLLLSLVVVLLMMGTFVAGGFAGWVLHGSPPPEGQSSATPSAPIPTPRTDLAQELTPEELQEQFESFWAVWSLLENTFYDPSRVDNQEMVYGAIRGMVESVGDRYTFFSTPAQTDVSETHLRGEYEGIGAWIDQQNGFPVILGPVHDDAPAARAGLRSGDIVIMVDGVEVEGMPLEEVIGMIKGPAGTEVTLTILREGEAAPFDVTLTRAHIEVPSVEGETREDGLAYVRVSVFGDRTAYELDQILLELLQEDPGGLILDLRGNGGGYLTAAQEILGRFLREGVATYQAGRDGDRLPLMIIPGEAEVYELPMVVLVDGGSASASEITAGALQDAGRAVLIGEETFGKGLIQNITDLPDGSSVRITTAQWLTREGRQIHDKGLTPDIVVPLTPEDYEAERDPQLDAAVAYLLGNPLPETAATPNP